MGGLGPFVSRRRLVAGLGSMLVVPPGCAAAAPGLGGRWLSAHGDTEQTYGLVAADPQGAATIIETGFRGHGLAANPGDPDRVVMFGRRPGTTSVVLDVGRGEVVRRFESTAHRRFCGHGCFSADGRLLLSTEADVQTAHGAIVVRDAESLDVVDVYDAHGIGPHEMVLMPGGDTLAVANGGLLTRPETGSVPQNLDTMESSLVYIDLGSGELVSRHRVAEPKASLRHLAVSEDGVVVVVMQIQRESLEDTEPRPLIAVMHPGGQLRELHEGVEFGTAMDDYAGSVAVDSRSRLAAVTSPRGNLVTMWNYDTGKFASYHEFDDVCGVTVDGELGHFVCSGSSGRVRVLDTATLQDVREARRRFDDVRWDNHMIAVAT